MTKIKKNSNEKFSKIRKRRWVINPETVLIVKQILLGIFIFSIVGGVLVGIWHGVRLPALTISQIEVFDGETIKGEVIKQKVEEILVGEYLHFIPRRFTWFYPEDEIIKKIQEVERIKNIELEKVSATNLEIHFTEYFPYALWCGNENNNCYFIDESGFAFDQAPALSGESMLRYYRLGEDPVLQSNYIETSDFKKINDFTKLLEDKGWLVTEIEVDKVGDVFFTLINDSVVRTTLRDEANQPFSYLETLLSANEFSHLKPGNFQYVDLRFGSKVYVNEEKNVVASSTVGNDDEIEQDEVTIATVVVSEPAQDQVVENDITTTISSEISE